MNREHLLERINSVVETSARALFAANGMALGKLVGDTATRRATTTLRAASASPPARSAARFS